MLKNRWTVALGAAFTAAVVVPLLVAYLSPVVVPQDFCWEQPPRVILCPDVPEWVGEESSVAEGMLFWEDAGYMFGPISAGGCSLLCDSPVGMVPCQPGAITVTLATSSAPSNHIGNCTVGGEGAQRWGAITVSGYIGDQLDGLPRDAEDLIIAHELGHCLGLGHAEGPDLPWRFKLPPPAGHVMNPVVEKVGWGHDGVPGCRGSL